MLILDIKNIIFFNSWNVIPDIKSSISASNDVIIDVNIFFYFFFYFSSGNPIPDIKN